VAILLKCVREINYFVKTLSVLAVLKKKEYLEFTAFLCV